MLVFLVILAVLAHALVESDPLAVQVALAHESAPAVFTLEAALQATNGAVAGTLRLEIFSYLILLIVDATRTVIGGVRGRSMILFRFIIIYG
jgi:hypothetical protein